ncbi:MAG: hypothetical protein KZQ75_09340 [Candidatus Thiodiazotropha sp. (ex Myrtea spinifera)]|nr:hypothetical protein [Candidatus Thiodiazotropha sp. (ex Myrtea spinifera)]
MNPRHGLLLYDSSLNTYHPIMIRKDGTYRLATSYGIISFIAVAITAACIFLFFRYQTINIIEEASKRSNEVLTIATEYALNDHFVMFLNIANQKKAFNKIEPALEPTLDRAIKKLLLDTVVVRVKVYDKEGNVAYSTKASQIGSGQEDNDGFKSALRGEPATVLIYRDTFNLFDQEVEDENLVQTYVPIRISRTGNIIGVFEVYSDISDYVRQSNQTIIIVSFIITLAMMILYAFLLLHIKRSERIITDQHKETQEKKKMLEYLTAKMINAQEDEKKRIAFELHEDVVQTISGVKMQLERYIYSVEQIEDGSSIKQLSKDIVPILQEAAHKIRSVAIDLRPPSLDDFGLKAAVNSLISECHTMTSGLLIKVDLNIQENEISQEQKTIFYRIFKDTLKMVCFDQQLSGAMNLLLAHFDQQLVLKIELLCEDLNLNNPDGILPVYFESMQERTILSGGEFEVDEQSKDRLAVRSVWFF